MVRTAQRGGAKQSIVHRIRCWVSDAVNFSRQFTGQGSNTSCTPPGVTMGQEADVVLNYLNRNQDKRDLAAAALVVAAMDEAWCPQAPAAPSVQYKPH